MDKKEHMKCPWLLCAGLCTNDVNLLRAVFRQTFPHFHLLFSLVFSNKKVQFLPHSVFKPHLSYVFFDFI